MISSVSQTAELVAPEAILIPSAGILADGQPSPWFTARLDKAAELYAATGGLLMVLGCGTPHAEPVRRDGKTIYESAAGADYLTRIHGVDPKALRQEALSLDTVGNAWFARLLLDQEPGAIRNLLVVGSDIHMTRVEWVFRHIFGLQPGSDRYALQFMGVADTALPPDILAARAAREEFAINKARRRFGHTVTKWEFQSWLIANHELYSPVLKRRRRPEALPPELTQIY